MRDPKYREARREQGRVSYARQRDDLIQILHLTPEQADAVIGTQLDRDDWWWDQPPGRVDDSPQAQEEHQARVDAAYRAYQDELGKLLGEQKRTEFNDYIESRGTRRLVEQLRVQLRDGHALRDDQVEPLIAALHAEGAQMRRDLDEYASTQKNLGAAEDPVKFDAKQLQLMKAMHARMHAAAGAVLSQSQVKALDGMLAREREQFEAQQRLARIQQKLDQADFEAKAPD
jgi:hypothetical protein